MGQKLRLSPLVEAVCEFRFAPNLERVWDWAAPDKLYDQVKNEFPIRSQLVDVDLRVVVPQVGGTLHPGQLLTQQISRVQLKSSDESLMVQLCPNLLVVNALQPYRSWEYFKEKILGILLKYINIAGESPFESIGLRYINNIDIPFGIEKFDIEEFIVCEPNIPIEISNIPMTSFHQRNEFLNESLPGIMIHQSGLMKNSATDRHMILLDLDVINSTQIIPNTYGISKNEVKDWLEEAHTFIETVFRASLNQDYYKSII
jgi:uncharacterized protein (TIGR04255 family)